MIRSLTSTILIGCFWASTLLAGIPGISDYQKRIQQQYPGWSFIPQSMLSAPQYKDYPGASVELTLGDKSRVVLISRKGTERIEYQVIHIFNNGKATSLIHDSWAYGNPVPFLLPNKQNYQKDIKNKKTYNVSLDRSFVFDEWAYRWVIAYVNGKWTRILVQSED